MKKHQKRTDPGTHVSDFAGRCLRKTYFDITDAIDPTPELIWLFLRGKILHMMLEIEGETELELDGIQGHADDSFFGDLIEWKTTNYSTNPTKEGEHRWNIGDKKLGHPPPYVSQVMCYAKMAGTLQVTLALLHLMGDYGKNRKPTLKVFDLIFEQEELDDHWDFIQDRKWILEQAIEAKTSPPVSTRWFMDECKYCPYVERCMDELKAEAIDG